MPPAEAQPPALIINHGSIPGLVATWAEGVVRPKKAGSPQPVAWMPMDDRPARLQRRDAVLRQVELCSLGGFSERQVLKLDVQPGLGGLGSMGTPAATIPEPLINGGRATAMLVSAVIEAATLGLGRVIWPVHAGAKNTEGGIDLGQLADVCDRALLVAQLVGLDLAKCQPAVSTIKIQTPYADLSDDELMDLALDMDAPLHASWWCLNEGKTPCAHCSACMRWREALVQVDPAGTLDIQVLAKDLASLKPALKPVP